MSSKIANSMDVLVNLPISTAGTNKTIREHYESHPSLKLITPESGLQRHATNSVKYRRT